MFSWIALALGIVNLAYAAYLRRDSDRTRRIIANRGAMDERMAFIFVPGLALVFLGMGLLQFAVLMPGLAQSVALTVCVVLAAAGFLALVVSLLRVPYPKKIIPAWAREVAKARDAGRLPTSQTRPRSDWSSAQRQAESAERKRVREARRERKAQAKGSANSAKKRRPR
ncbi:hypothetical protein H8R18_07370 [Nanchangia anserum]|uniref:Uncharacterized protein n=1 Tax=Nanchangia anserum TaxID=2692125 RepID=A0A8I0GG02_9ACTO|nr:hypothetical protein [Nanchangia anserum]MBD3689344.1 hypothetical protein [Nanchangia anserum]QOX81551.1 hypothetical protein H8R18_07370 [Nanchangia anserum]